jgi:DNA-binding IclR family transcriptional regulator
VIQSVDRAARILKALAAHPGRLGVSELSERLGLAKGTVHGLLRTMQAHGLVEQHSDSDKYQLGPELLQLSYRYLDLNELRTRSLIWAEQLVSRTQESVRVGAFRGDQVLIVHHAFRPDASLQILEVGEVLPMHATALGKALLAYLPEDVVKEILKDPPRPLTRNTARTVEDVERDLEVVRDRGYATEHEEAVLGEAGVAAPVFDRRGNAIGAIGIACPDGQLTSRRVEREIGPAVIEAARGVSRDLGAVTWPVLPGAAALWDTGRRTSGR